MQFVSITMHLHAKFHFNTFIAYSLTPKQLVDVLQEIDELNVLMAILMLLDL